MNDRPAASNFTLVLQHHSWLSDDLRALQTVVRLRTVQGRTELSAEKPAASSLCASLVWNSTFKPHCSFRSYSPAIFMPDPAIVDVDEDQTSLLSTTSVHPHPATVTS